MDRKKLRAEKTEQLIQTSFIELLKKKGSSGRFQLQRFAERQKSTEEPFICIMRQWIS